MSLLRTKTALLAGLVFCSPALATAADNLFTSPDQNFTIYGGIGFANIKAGEYVYDGSHKLSQLDWESKGVTLYTFGAMADLDKNWSVKADVNIGANGNGHMVDYDWLVYSIDDWTHRSTHPDTKLDHYFNGSIEVDRDVYSNDATTLDLGLGFSYSDVKWSAFGGSYIYSTSALHDTVGSFADGERAISYRQKIPVAFLAANAEHRIGAFTISGGVKGGLSFGIEDIDDHWMRDLRFYDSMGAAPMLGANVAVNYEFTQNAAFYVAGNFEKVFRTKGDVRMVDTTGASDDEHYSNGAGADFQAVSISFGLKGKF